MNHSVVTGASSRRGRIALTPLLSIGVRCWPLKVETRPEPRRARLVLINKEYS
jgi:hypothetical protein